MINKMNNDNSLNVLKYKDDYIYIYIYIYIKEAQSNLNLDRVKNTTFHIY